MRSTTLALLTLTLLAVGAPGASGQPLRAHPGPAPAPEAPAGAPALKGKVLETMNSGGYTYLKLATADGEMWAAVLPVAVEVGATVEIENPMVMRDFEARSLGRTFDQIVFGTLAGSAPGAPHARARDETMEAVPPMRKPEGAEARTVAEVWKDRTALKGKRVALRGKVVKFNGGIMGRNWLHLQDGTGTKEGANFDLAVTTHDDVQIGDVVIVRGVVDVDKNFGAGYAYPVIVEDAKVTKDAGAR